MKVEFVVIIVENMSKMKFTRNYSLFTNCNINKLTSGVNLFKLKRLHKYKIKTKKGTI